jgi:hypothetical protein
MKRKKKEITFSIESNDDEISQMVTDELIRLRRNLNSVDNEVNNDDLIRLIYSLLFIDFRLYFTRRTSG